MKVLVLGAGRVGKAIVVALASDSRFSVTVADRSREALAGAASRSDAIVTQQADLESRSELEKLILENDLVIGALPSFLGYWAVRMAIACGRDCVDVSFMEEDPMSLHAEAEDAGVTVVVDCGLAPGLSSLILGSFVSRPGTIERYACYVGGLPARPTPPWEYKAPFSPADVIVEYTRPARFRAEGKEIVEPALSGLEELEIDGAGRLEAFNTDGLRTLLSTVAVPNMIEKTLRYPGHAEKVKLLKESGFLADEPVDVGGVPVSPVALTSALLFEQWRFEPGEPDLTVMRLELEVRYRSSRESHRFELIDHYDPIADLSSMARTTGFTCSSIARLVADGAFRRPGISAPEHVGMRPDCCQRVLRDLAERGIRLTEV